MDEMYILFYKDKCKTLNHYKKTEEAFLIAIHPNNSLIVYSSSQYILLQNTTDLLIQKFKINLITKTQFFYCLNIQFSQYFPYILTVHRDFAYKYFIIWKMDSKNKLRQYAQYSANYRDNQECFPFFFQTKQIGLIESKCIVEIIMLRTKKILFKIKLYQNQRHNFRQNSILYSLHQYFIDAFDLKTRRNKRTLLNDDINELACQISQDANFVLFKNINNQVIMTKLDNINIPLRVLPINPEYYAKIHYNQYLHQLLICNIKLKQRGKEEKWLLIYDFLKQKRSEQRFGKFENYAVSENLKFVVTSSVKDSIRIYRWRR